MSSPVETSPSTAREDRSKDALRETRGLEGWGNGQLEPLYGELRALADRFFTSERADHTLQPTALVHEAYLRLSRGRTEWNDRKHFFAMAARAMRHVLLDHARAKRRSKRGGGCSRVELRTAVLAGETHGTWSVDPLSLERALRELSRLSERQGRVVELRFFADLSNAAIAELLGVSERTVERDWRHARAWLWRSLEHSRAGPDLG